MYNLTENGLEVNHYDIETEKWGEKWTFNLPNQEHAEDAPYFEVLNGKIYIIAAIDNGHTLSISRCKNRRTLI